MSYMFGIWKWLSWKQKWLEGTEQRMQSSCIGMMDVMVVTSSNGSADEYEIQSDSLIFAFEINQPNLQGIKKW